MEYIDLIAKRKYDEAEKIMKKLVPSKLYKFVSLSDCKDLNQSKIQCIYDDSFYFSSVSNENDPYEFQGVYIDEDTLIRNGWDTQTAEYLKKQFDGVFKNNFAIACLTANNEHCLPMWAYYTNNYQGYCIEYEVQENNHIHKVYYEEKRIAIANLLSKMAHAVTENNAEDREFFSRIVCETVFLKHHSWSWEKEYRIISSKKEMTEHGHMKKLKSIGLKPTRVIVGIHCKEEHKKEIKEICAKKSIVYNQAIVSKRTFGFEEI